MSNCSPCSRIDAPMGRDSGSRDDHQPAKLMLVIGEVVNVAGGDRAFGKSFFWGRYPRFNVHFFPWTGSAQDLLRIVVKKGCFWAKSEGE